LPSREALLLAHPGSGLMHLPIIVAFASPGGGAHRKLAFQLLHFLAQLIATAAMSCCCFASRSPDRQPRDVLIHDVGVELRVILRQVQLLRALEIARSPFQRVSTVP